MLPQVGLIIPLYVVLARYHLTNTLTGVILTYLTFVLPFAVWTLRGFILGIPKELEEAAMVDGSSRLGAFVRILLPLVAPGLVATSVFAFVTTWNEYIFASVLLSDQSNQTVTVWLSYFYGTSRNTDWGALMAASTLTAIPVVVFFLLVQRRIAFGLTAGCDEGMSAHARAPRAGVHPARLRGRGGARRGSCASSRPDSAGSCSSRATSRDPEQLRALTASIRVSPDDRGRDRRGGRRRDPPRGGAWELRPGRARARRRSTTSTLTERGRASPSPARCARRGSPTTSPPSPTSTRTR